MRRLSVVVVSLGLLAVAVLAHAGGSFYGLTPGRLREVKGKIAEYDVPTPLYPHGPAAADGKLGVLE